jgi:hypothetical protein
MTEVEWMEAVDPDKMLEYLRDRTSGRKLPLFACACCRRIWHRIPDPRSRHAVESVERYLDGGVSTAGLDDVRRDAEQAELDRKSRDWRLATGEHAVLVTTLAPVWNPDRWPSIRTVINNARFAAAFCAEVAGGNRKERRQKWQAGHESESAAQADLLRDIFGNPFRPVAFAPEWRTAAAVALADAMYQSRDFGPMPVLADALEDAGCADPDVLAHCRGDGPHVRGCWVVDAVLEKS